MGIKKTQVNRFCIFCNKRKIYFFAIPGGTKWISFSRIYFEIHVLPLSSTQTVSSLRLCKCHWQQYLLMRFSILRVRNDKPELRSYNLVVLILPENNDAAPEIR